MPKIIKKIIPIILSFTLGLAGGLAGNFVYDLYKEFKPTINIISVNGITVSDHFNNYKKTDYFIPIQNNKISVEGIFILGKIESWIENGKYDVYIVIFDFDKYYIQNTAATEVLINEDTYSKSKGLKSWKGYFNIPKDEGSKSNEKDYILYTILVDSKYKLCLEPKDYISGHISQSKGVHLKLNSELRSKELPIIEEKKYKTCSSYEVDIYLGRHNISENNVTYYNITANLLYNGFTEPVNAEIDWGEGKGWETTSTPGQGFYYLEKNLYEKPGKKAVIFRVTGEEGKSLEKSDVIEITDQKS